MAMIFLQKCGAAGCGKAVRAHKKGFEHVEALSRGVKFDHKVDAVTTERVE